MVSSGYEFNKWMADEAEKLKKLKEDLHEQIADNVHVRKEIDALSNGK